MGACPPCFRRVLVRLAPLETEARGHPKLSASGNPNGWLHIDNRAQFYDRSASAITLEAALVPLGLSTADTRGHSHAKETTAGSSLGYSI